MNFLQTTMVRLKALGAKGEYMRQIEQTRKSLTDKMALWETELELDADFLMVGAVERAKHLSNHSWNFPMFLPYDWYLYCLVRLTNPKVVIETGVERGASTYCILKAMQLNGSGSLFSIDRTPKRFSYYGLDIAPVVPRELLKAGKWTHLEGLSTEKLPALLKQVGAVDIFIAGSAHTTENQRFECFTAWPHITSYLIVDRPDYEGNDYWVWNALLEKNPNSWSCLMPESYSNLPYKFGVIKK